MSCLHGVRALCCAGMHRLSSMDLTFVIISLEMQASVCGQQPLVAADDLLLESWMSTAVEHVKCVEGVRCRTLRSCPNVIRGSDKVTLAEMLHWNNACM